MKDSPIFLYHVTVSSKMFTKEVVAKRVNRSLLPCVFKWTKDSFSKEMKPKKNKLIKNQDYQINKFVHNRNTNAGFAQFHNLDCDSFRSFYRRRMNFDIFVSHIMCIQNHPFNIYLGKNVNLNFKQVLRPLMKVGYSSCRL